MNDEKEEKEYKDSRDRIEEDVKDSSTKKGKFKKVLLSILGIVLIGGITYGSYSYGYKKSDDDSTKKQTTVKSSDKVEDKTSDVGTKTDSTQEVKEDVVVLQPEDVTTKIKNTYQQQYRFIDLDEDSAPLRANDQPKQGEMRIITYKHAPQYKAEGFNFYTNYDGGSTVDLLTGPINRTTDTFPRTIDTTIRTEVANTFKSFGLVKTGTYGGNANPSVGVDVYTGKGLICTIDAPADSSNSNRASCGRIDAYKTAAENMQQFTKVLPGVKESTAFGGLKVKNSIVSGYQRASVSQGDINYSVGGGFALLYRKDNGPWVYFQSVQNVLSCSEYNTVDLRNAFQGVFCSDANNMDSTVQ